MTSKLYTNTLNDELNAELSEHFRSKQIDQVTDELVSSEKVLSSKPTFKKFFTTNSKTGKKFSYDNTVFAPLPFTLLSGKKFEAEYMKQLESIIYNKEDQLDHEKIINLTRMYEIATTSPRPIILTSQAYRKLTPTVCSVLNRFFNQHGNVIGGILKMLQ